jgi:hypothetical protein
VVNAVVDTPIIAKPIATSANPTPQVFVSPKALKIGAKKSVDMLSDTKLKDVNVAPIIVGPIPTVFEITRGKNESNVD